MLTVQKPKNNLKQFWIALEDGLVDASKKIEFLRNFKTSKNLALVQYPSGSPLQTIHQVCKCLQGAEFINFEDLTIASFDVGHSKTFHLVRNNTSLHDSFEAKQKATGGINSSEIMDVGEFRVACVDDTEEIIDKADYTLYVTSDIFAI